MYITYHKGDATSPVDVLTRHNKIIAHVCNDIGAWGAGFSGALSQKYPQAERSYRRWYTHNTTAKLSRGLTQFVHLSERLTIANMIAQSGVGTDRVRLDYVALESTLVQVAEAADALRASVHMPRIGSGLAGGKWEEIALVIGRTLLKYNVPTYVYDLE